MLYTIVFNLGAAQQVIIDHVCYTLEANTALPLMVNQNFTFERPEQVIAVNFNREFYCVVEQDAEVGCVGFLFYGLAPAVFIGLSHESQNLIESILFAINKELDTDEDLKEPMLRTYLTALIITLTRLARKQYYDMDKEKEPFYILRHLNLLIEKHYKRERQVKFYSDMLNRSPKTLSHICAHYARKPPIKIIHDRVILESKRLIYHSDLSIKEIAAYLGFEHAAQFSKFFKNITGQNPTAYRQDAQEKSANGHLATKPLDFDRHRENLTSTLTAYPPYI
jgi:AraC family transcriptional regulator, transcriptional activator of pobA